LAIAPNIATMSRAFESKGHSEREKEREKEREREREREREKKGRL